VTVNADAAQLNTVTGMLSQLSMVRRSREVCQPEEAQIEYFRCNRSGGGVRTMASGLYDSDVSVLRGRANGCVFAFDRLVAVSDTVDVKRKEIQ
jgi:hypothetical protein